MSTSYNTPAVGGESNATVLKPSSPITDNTGRVSRDWWRYFNSLTSAPKKESVVIVGASPTTYTATENGTLLVQGGTVSSIIINRLNDHATGVTQGLFPLSVGDELKVTYTVVPNMVWFPR